MQTDAKARRREILSTVTHYITAFVILMKGADKVGTPGKEGIGVFFLIVAAFLFVGTLFHHRFEKALKNFKLYVIALEAIVVGLVGYLYLKEGRGLLPYVYFFASLMFFVGLIVNIVTKDKQSSSH